MPEPGKRLELVAKLLLPICAGISLVAVMSGRSARVDHELHLIAPRRTEGGTQLPVRAHFYTGLSAIEGAHLEQPSIRLFLRQGDAGAGGAAVPMTAGHAGSLQANLPVPPAAVGPAQLVAEYTYEGVAQRMVVPIRLGAGPGPEPPRGRALRALQQLAPAPLKRLGEGPLPRLQVAVAGGVCVPEQVCEVAVWLGSPAAALAVEAYAGLEVLSANPAASTDNVALFRVRVHGPEAELRLRASRAGLPVASRRVRLPIALGAAALGERLRMTPTGTPLALEVGGADEGCIVDAYHAGRWRQTTSYPACAGQLPLPFNARLPGPWRLQLRTDPFSAGNAAVAEFWASDLPAGDWRALQALARSVLRRHPQQIYAGQVAATPRPFAGAQLQATATFLTALLERGIRPLPAATSSLPQAQARLAGQRARLRGTALWVVALSALLFLLMLARRGLEAGKRARGILLAAGAKEADSGARRLRTTLTVLSAVAALSLAFAAIAMYVIARG